MGICDLVPPCEHVGCADLAARIMIFKPKVLALGHIHEGSRALVSDGMTSVSGSICDRADVPVNPVSVVDI